MIDIHSHILPSVDDGAKDMNEALDMAMIAVENGTKTIIATPHYIEGENYNNHEKNLDILNVLNEELRKNDIDIEVLLGNELFVTFDVFKLLDAKKITTLNDTRYLLIEFPRMDMPIYVENLIYNLRLKGIIPIIAHPERYLKVMEDPNLLHNFITKGALCQLNLPSLSGRYGEKVKETAEILLNHNMIHFIGSDAHNSRRATPEVRKSIEILRIIVGSEKSNKLMSDNPDKMIKNEDIEIDEPIMYKCDGVIKRFLKNSYFYKFRNN